MAEPRKLYLTGLDGRRFAELLITDEEEGWFTGSVIWQNFPGEVREALAWYDEVVRDQMLSYLDEAVAAVQRFGLRAELPDGSTHETFSLDISPAHEVSFRTSPVLPAPELSKQASH